MVGKPASHGNLWSRVLLFIDSGISMQKRNCNFELAKAYLSESSLKYFGWGRSSEGIFNKRLVNKAALHFLAREHFNFLTI